MISIIIPSYNHSKYIKKCIDSVTSQTYQDWELIIIDDGSQDNSNEIISQYNDKRIMHIQQENAGAHNAINRGLSLANGKYLTILNSDDEFHKDRLQECINQFEQQPNIDFISTWIYIVDDASKVLGIKEAWKNMHPWEIKNQNLTFLDSDDYALNALMANFVSTTSNMIFRRKVYEEVGGMRNLRFAHDWDFLLRICSRFNCYNLEKPLMNYRIHGTNTISSNRKWMLFEVCWIIASNIDKFANNIMPSFSHESLKKSSMNLLESFNFQGNEKIFWLLYFQITTMKKQGLINPEEVYLQDIELRNEIIKYIKD